MDVTQSPDKTESVATAVRFLTAVFAPEDLVLFRPVETWTENGKKKSKVDYNRTRHRPADRDIVTRSISRIVDDSNLYRTNEFFGVCPRFGDQGRYDLAWQIRIVRVLWADIDDVTVKDALERVAKAGLPQPSIVVNSGNGVHVYWILDQPYLIDDVGPPPPVETEWEELPGGKKKPRKYIVEDGERFFLEKRHHAVRLSVKAQHLQDILAGIAKAIGGDHTTDLARLLRLPGTWNRKDERNGREPVKCQLIECDETRRYGISVFERFQTPSPDTERYAKIQTMPLPKVRKASASKADRLSELVAASGIATPGHRSEADFGLCCFAIKNGFDKELVWSEVEQVGKFGEQGRRYFDITWEKAEFECRADLLGKLSGESKKSRQPPPQAAEESWEPPNGESETSDRPSIHIDPTSTPVAGTLREVTDCLVAAKNCFLRCNQLVEIHNEDINPVLTTSELQGLLNQHVEFYFVDDEAGRYKPLTPDYCNTWLNQRTERSRLPEIKLFTRNPVFTEDWRLVAPGFDRESGIYYAGPVVTAQHGTATLDLLLQDFCFKTPADRTNYIGMLLTGILIPRFIGAKPAALFNGNQPGLGKSILAQIIAVLRDGHATETASYNPNDEEFEKRLGSIVRRGVTTIIIDNAKGHGRKPRIESACLERSITDQVLSFRLLGKSQEIRAENSHIFGITANSTDVSPDLVSRSDVINLEYEGDPRRRTFHIADPEAYAAEHRFELLGELIGMVHRWLDGGKPMADVATRFNKKGWGHIIGGILQFNGQQGFLTNADEAAAQLDDTRREFTELVAILADHPQGTWTPTDLVELCQREGLLLKDLGDGTARSLATKFGTISGRYVDERFSTPDGRVVVFIREKQRQGNVCRVAVLEEGAEP